MPFGGLEVIMSAIQLQAAEEINHLLTVLLFSNHFWHIDRNKPVFFISVRHKLKHTR